MQSNDLTRFQPYYAEMLQYTFFPPFFLRGLWPLPTSAAMAVTAGPGVRPAFAAAGTALPRAGAGVAGRFQRCGGGGFVSRRLSCFCRDSSGLARASRRRQGGRRFPAGSMGVPGAGPACPVCDMSATGEVAPASGCTPDFCADCSVFASVRAAFCSVLRAGRCARLSGVRIRADAVRIWLRRSGPGSFGSPGAGRTLAAFCAGFPRRGGLRRAYSGTGPSVGIVSPVKFWMSQRYSNSSPGRTTAAPSCPARGPCGRWWT